jgi:hypothetical protein
MKDILGRTSCISAATQLGPLLKNVQFTILEQSPGEVHVYILMKAEARSRIQVARSDHGQTMSELIPSRGEKCQKDCIFLSSK